jgi:hypothetical protein
VKAGAAQGVDGPPALVQTRRQEATMPTMTGRERKRLRTAALRLRDACDALARDLLALLPPEDRARELRRRQARRQVTA